MNANGTGDGTTETGTEIPEHELRETLALFKHDLQEKREDLSDKIMKHYMDGKPIHLIRPLEERLKQLEADIQSFKQ